MKTKLKNAVLTMIIPLERMVSLTLSRLFTPNIATALVTNTMLDM